MSEFVEQVAVLLSIALLHRYILRFLGINTIKAQIASGCLFGLMCLYVMSTPFTLVPGVIFDSRSVVLSLAGLFSGPIGSLITAAIASTYRVVLSGTGMEVGVTTILMCTLAGLVYRHMYVQGRAKMSAFNFLILGMIVHTIELGLFLLLPDPIGKNAVAAVYLPFYFILCPGVIFLGLLLMDNEKSVQLARDLTRKTREALRSEMALQKVFSDLKQKQDLIDEHAIYSETDIKGNITSVNQLFCDISGFTEEELIGKNHNILNSGEHPPEFFGNLWGTIKRGKTWRGDLKNHRKDGVEYWVKSTISPRRDQNGKIIGYASIRTDVTEDIQRQNEALEAKNEALEANAAKSRFIATMSHELRTPLNAILGFSEMIMQETFGPLKNDKYREYITDINESGKSLKVMVDDILDLTRLDLKSFEFNNEYFDVIGASREIVDRFRHLAERSGITFTYTASPNIPNRLYADRKVLLHILNNLISNSIKATGKGDRVTVSWEDDGSDLILSVADTGTGMTKETLNQLGQPFISNKDEYLSKAKSEGIGLGFYITKSFVEARSGSINVESAPGEGTRITIRYPKSAFLSNETVDKAATS